MTEWFKRLFDARRLREIEMNAAIILMIETVMKNTRHRHNDIDISEIVALNERMIALRFRNIDLTERLSLRAQSVLVQKKLEK